MSTNNSGCLKVIDLGLFDYREAWTFQHTLFDGMVEKKKGGIKPEKEYLIIVEHPPVITLGRHAHQENVLLSYDALRERGIEVFEIERGGDVTFHAPGQLVAYPILDLEQHHLGVKDYVWHLEEAVILTIAHYGIKGERIEGASGVWIGKGGDKERKICALGVKCSRFCTMHGLALNVNTDLSGFNAINPCGFIDRGVTSIAKETGKDMDFEEVKSIFVKEFSALFQPHTLFQGRP